MRPDDIDRRLRAELAPPHRDRTRHRRALEKELRARHGRLYPPRERWTMLKQTTWFRPVVASLAVLILGVAACNAPTSYDVEMGKRMTITMDGAQKDGADFDGLHAQIEAIVQFVDTFPGTDQVMVNVQETTDGVVALGLMIWGQSLDADALQQALIEEFPVLTEAEFAVDPLTGTVEGNLGEAFGHAVFDFEVDGETAEEIRAQILQQLMEQGFDGEADVQVHVDEEAGTQTIDIELRSDEDVEGGAAAGDGDEQGQRIVIEEKSD
jgi:hypothetical protein